MGTGSVLRSKAFRLHRTASVLVALLWLECGCVGRFGVGVGFGVGVDELRDAAHVCGESGGHLEAAQLLWAASAVRGVAAAGRAGELQRAWASIKLLETAGRGSPGSRALESRVDLCTDASLSSTVY